MKGEYFSGKFVKRYILGVLPVCFLVSAMVVMVSCQTQSSSTENPPKQKQTLTITPTQTSAGPFSFADSLDTDSNPFNILIETDKERYQNGEKITITIKNTSEESISYLGGCDWLGIERIEDDKLIGLVRVITESVPSYWEIEPGQEESCSWYQRAYQDPDEPLEYRFVSYERYLLVPPGQYQIVLSYYPTEELNKAPEMRAVSNVFTISEEVSDESMKSCQTDSECTPISCSCLCSEIGLVYEDIVNRRYTDAWTYQHECASLMNCAGMECSPVKAVCQNHVCIAETPDEGASK